MNPLSRSHCKKRKGNGNGTQYLYNSESRAIDGTMPRKSKKDSEDGIEIMSSPTTDDVSPRSAKRKELASDELLTDEQIE